MSLKLSVLIDANASSLKSEAAASKTAIGAIGTSAAGAAQDVARLDTALAKTAGTSREASAAVGALSSAEKTAATSAKVAGTAIDAARQATDNLGQAARSTSGEMAGVQAALTGAGTSARELQATLAGVEAAQARAITRISTGAGVSSTVLKETGDAAKLTASQVQGLGYQINDVATMLAMGASPFQVIASQAGQVVQVLGDGPGGMKGSLAAIGSVITGLVTPVTVATAGLVAAGAAVVYFATRGEREIKPLNEALETHSATLKRIAKDYGLVSIEQGKLQRASLGNATFDLRRSRSELELSARQSLRSGFDRSFGDALFGETIFGGRIGGQGRAAVQITETYKAFEAPLLRVLDGLGKGKVEAAEFVEEVARIANLQPSNAELQKMAKRLVDLAAPAAEAQRLLADFTQSAEEAAKAGARIAGATRMREVGDQLRDLAPDRETERGRIERLYREQMNIASTIGGSPRSMQGEIIRINRERSVALDELNRKEEAARRGRELDIAGIRAVTVAERARLAAELERNSALPGDDPRETDARAAAAATEVYAEAERSAADALRESKSARAQAGLVGYAADQAAIAAQYEREIELAGGSAAAIRDLTEARAQDLAALEESTRRDLFAGQESQLRALEVEAGLIAANDNARTKALATLRAEEELRRAGIEVNGEWGRSYVENAQALAQFEDGIRRQADAFEEMRDAAKDAFFDIVDALGSGEDALGAFASAFAGIGRKMASAGFDKIVGSLFGSAGGSVGSPTLKTGGAGGLASVPAYSSGSSDQTYAAPVGAVERSILPALTSATSGLNAAAKAIRTIESGSAAGNYSAIGPVTRSGDRAYGAYQIMGANIPEWSRAAIGREIGKTEFLKSVELQDRIFEHRFGKYLTKYGAEGASRAWFAGEGGMRNWTAQDAVGTSVSGYGGKFSRLYQQHSANDNVASSTSDAKVVAKGVTDGMQDFSRREESRGAYPWAGMQESDVQRGNPGAGLFSERAMKGFEVLGAGLGAFGAGYQSGSPLSGGISGAFGGYQAGGAISSFLGVGAGAGAALGVVGGAALGILGGILGARKQREQAHRDKAAKWEELRPQYEAFDQSLSGEGVGQLREWITAQEGQFAQFRKVGGDAWKYGTGNSSEQFASTGTKMWTRFMEMQKEYREGLPDLVEDLTSGEGYEGAFAKGRAAAKDLKQRIKDMIDDVSIAFGSADIGVGVSAEWEAASKTMEERRNAAIAQAKNAAGEYALSLLYTAATSTEVEKSLDGFRGTAAGLHQVLIDLGWSAEKAAADIDQRLTQAIAKMGETFVDGYQRSINDLQGKGYLNDVTDLITARDTGLKEADKLGVDRSIVSKWFDLAAQDVVDGAELVGTAFDDLVKAFPELKGIIKEFTDASEAAGLTLKEIGEAMQHASVSRYQRAVQERAEAENDLLSAYQGTVSFVKGIGTALTGMRLDASLSTLSGKDRVEEALKLFRETAAKADAGDRDAQEQLVGVGQDALQAAKDYYVSSAGYGAIYAEIEATLKGTATRAQSQLDVMKSQASFLSEMVAEQRSLNDLFKTWMEKSTAVTSAQDELDRNRGWGVRPERNRKNVAEFRAAGLPEYTGNFGPDTWPQIQAWLDTLTVDQRAKAMQIMEANNVINRQAGGLIPRFAGGGVVSNGIFNQDSVFASVQGGGGAMLAGGEAIVTAPAVTAETLPFIDYLNRNHRLPPMPAASGAGGADVVAELRLLRASNDAMQRQLIALTGAKADQTIAAIERGNRTAEGSAADARRGRSLQSTRTAA